MIPGFSNFKVLSADCEVYIRQLSVQRMDNRLISNIRRVSRASGGFVVDTDIPFQVHTLVEMDVKFFGQPHYYRSRGLVEWRAKSNNSEKPVQLGIRLISMEKLDPLGTPMTQSRVRKPAVAPRVSKRAESPVPQAPPEVSSIPEQEPAVKSELKKAVHRFTELKIPKSREVSEILTSLIGEKVEVENANRPLSVDDIAVVGAYKGEDGRILSVVGADIALANWLGAALAMLPKDVARADIETQRISDETQQNTQEIFNITTSVLNAPGIPHHRFVRLYNCFNSEQPQEVQHLMDRPVDRIDFEVEVPGYGAGRLCYLFAEWHSDADNYAPADDDVDDAASNPSLSDKKDAPPVNDLAKTQFVTPEELAAELPKGGPSFTPVPPKARDIAELFSNLVGDEVIADAAKEGPLDEDAFAVIGNYLTDDNFTIVLCAMDIHLANWAAAALAMIPKDVVKMDIENRRLSDESRDNVQEILNIAASVFNKPGMPHLRFGKLLVTMEGEPSPEYKPLIASPTERRDFTVKIPGYGEGVIACLIKSW